MPPHSNQTTEVEDVVEALAQRLAESVIDNEGLSADVRHSVSADLTALRNNVALMRSQSRPPPYTSAALAANPALNTTPPSPGSGQPQNSTEDGRAQRTPRSNRSYTENSPSVVTASLTTTPNSPYQANYTIHVYGSGHQASGVAASPTAVARLPEPAGQVLDVQPSGLPVGRDSALRYRAVPPLVKPPEADGHNCWYIVWVGYGTGVFRFPGVMGECIDGVRGRKFNVRYKPWEDVAREYQAKWWNREVRLVPCPDDVYNALTA